MKSEKKGNVKSALVILLLLTVTMTYRIVGTEFYFQSEQLAKFSFLLLAAAIVLLVVLFCIANWALTTLMDGKGSFSEIFMMLMYSLCPIILVNIPLTALTYFFVAEEATFYTLFNAVSIVWAVFLLFVGNMSIHEYSGIKSIATLILTVVAMAGIIVLVILAGNLVQTVWLWLGSIVKELSYRI
ncbi:MAG: hypothetical protein IJO62_04660 [Clostridia bacterium]|nr:hypothetical protein [Clostridia bacterium]